jgi:hypothetical protein
MMQVARAVQTEEMQWRLPTEGIAGCGVVLAIQHKVIHIEVEDDGGRLLDRFAWRGEASGHAIDDGAATSTLGRPQICEV